MTGAELASAIEQRAVQLARASTDAMLADPYWDARFGPRGERHAHQDGDFHVSYLVQALRLDSAALLANYACWLRSVLVPRGMCSHHLREHFRVLGDEVHRAGIHVPEGGLEVLGEAAAALTYEGGEAGAIDAVAGDVARAAATRLDGRPTPGRESEIREWISFLADALAAARPALFERHVAFMRSFGGRPGLAPVPVESVLDAISAELEAAVDPGVWREVALLLGRAPPAAEAP